VVREFAALLKTYRITEVQGDRYAGEWPRERFREHGIAYETAAKPKSDLYRDLLPAINSRKVDLLEDTRLIAQIVGLERRTARGGRDSIDHAPGAHDDVANAAAGVIAALASSNCDYDTMNWVNGPDRRSKPSTSEGDNRSTGGNSGGPSLHNISWKRSIDSIFDEVKD
jgi:hypothetical protein